MELILGVYRHYKGNFYEVIGEARHSETEEVLVVYRALYGDYGLWVRPKDMFQATVDYEDKQVLRFAYAGPRSSLGSLVHADENQAGGNKKSTAKLQGRNGFMIEEVAEDNG